MDGHSAPGRLGGGGGAGETEREVTQSRTVTDGGEVGCRSGGENEISRTRL